MSISPERGMGLLEIVIAMFITSVGLLAMLSLQSTGWKTVVRSDYLGRAAGILYKELETNEALIMNACLAVPAGSTRTVYASGQAGAVANAGDAAFTVQTAIADITPINSSPSIWRLTVTVTWPPINSTGITESIVVTGQTRFGFPVGCTPVR